MTSAVTKVCVTCAGEGSVGERHTTSWGEVLVVGPCAACGGAGALARSTPGPAADPAPAEEPYEPRGKEITVWQTRCGEASFSPPAESVRRVVIRVPTAWHLEQDPEKGIVLEDAFRRRVTPSEALRLTRFPWVRDHSEKTFDFVSGSFEVDGP